MGKLDSLVHNRSDRRRIIVKEFPERKSQDSAFDGGEGRDGVAGSDGLEAAVEVLAGAEYTAEHLAAEGGGPFAGHLPILDRHLLEAALVGGLGIVASGFGFVERLKDEAARTTKNVVGHAITMPPSTWMHWPVM